MFVGCCSRVSRIRQDVTVCLFALMASVAIVDSTHPNRVYAGQWTASTAAPYAASAMGVSPSNDGFVIAGGRTSQGTSVRSVAQFSSQSGLWTSLPDLPIGAMGPCVFADSEIVVVVGGASDLSTVGTSTFVLEFANISAGWQSGPTVPFNSGTQNRMSCMTTIFVALGLGPLFAGVSTTDGPFDEIWTLNTTLPGPTYMGRNSNYSSWTFHKLSAKLPESRTGFGFFHVDAEAISVFGGGFTSPSTATALWNPRTFAFTNFTPWADAKQYAGYASGYSDSVFSVGGYNLDSFTTFDQVYQWDIKGDSFNVLTPYPVSVREPACHVRPTTGSSALLHCVGGESADMRGLSAHYVVTISTNISVTPTAGATTRVAPASSSASVVGPAALLVAASFALF